MREEGEKCYNPGNDDSNDEADGKRMREKVRREMRVKEQIRQGDIFFSFVLEAWGLEPLCLSCKEKKKGERIV